MTILKKISIFCLATVCFLSFGIVLSGCDSNKTISQSTAYLAKIANNNKYKQYITAINDPITGKLNQIKLQELTSMTTIADADAHKNRYLVMLSTCNASIKGFNLFYNILAEPSILKNAKKSDIQSISTAVSNLEKTFDEIEASNKLLKLKLVIYPSTNASDLNLYLNAMAALDNFIDNVSKLSASVVNIFNNNLETLKLNLSENSVSIVSGQYEATILSNYYNVLPLIKNTILNNLTDSYFLFSQTASTPISLNTSSLILKFINLNKSIISKTNTLNKINYTETLVPSQISFNEFKANSLTQKPRFENYKIKENVTFNALKIIDLKKFKTSVIASEIHYNNRTVSSYISKNYNENKKNAYNSIIEFFNADVFNNISGQSTIISTCA